MSRIRTIQRLGAGVAVAVMALALPASAAELLTAELEGAANEVTVEQGTNQNFNVSLSASGNVACGSTHSAKVHTSYSVSAAGAVSSQTLSAPVNFSAASGSGNCNITWTGAPRPQTVAAVVSAAATTPVGTYTVILSEGNGNTATSSSNSTGPKLNDNNSTTLTIRVVAPTPPANTAPTVSVTGVADGASYEIGEVPAARCNVVDTEDGNTEFAASLSAITGPRSAHGIGSQTASCSYTDDGGLTRSVAATYSIVDTIDPTVAVTGFTSGQVFVHAVDALPTVGCDTQDAGSGVATSASPSSRGGPFGTVTVTCSGAVDNAGNSAEPVSQSYLVRYGRSGGIGQPINSDGSSQFSQKRAVPVKFALQGDEPSGFAVTGFTLFRTVVSCQGGVVVEDETAAQPVTTSTTWRYDSVDDQYIFNASLAGTMVGKCYQYQVDLGDEGPRVVSATFKVTK